MSLISEWEKLIHEKENELDDKIKRRIRLGFEINQKQAEIRALNEDIENCEVIIKRIRKEQWREEDKTINKLRTSGVIRESKGTKKTHSSR